jgi:hypothetical protein
VKHLPPALAPFKRHAARWKQALAEFVDAPYEYTRGQLSAGTAKPSFVSTLIEEKDGQLTAEEDFDLRWTANSMYGGAFKPSRPSSAVELLTTHLLKRALTPYVFAANATLVFSAD